VNIPIHYNDLGHPVKKRHATRRSAHEAANCCLFLLLKSGSKRDLLLSFIATVIFA
jgi:hypothetical protein